MTKTMITGQDNEESRTEEHYQTANQLFSLPGQRITGHILFVVGKRITSCYQINKHSVQATYNARQIFAKAFQEHLAIHISFHVFLLLWSCGVLCPLLLFKEMVGSSFYENFLCGQSKIILRPSDNFKNTCVIEMIWNGQPFLYLWT